MAVVGGVGLLVPSVVWPTVEWMSQPDRPTAAVTDFSATALPTFLIAMAVSFLATLPAPAAGALLIGAAFGEGTTRVSPVSMWARMVLGLQVGTAATAVALVAGLGLLLIDPPTSIGKTDLYGASWLSIVSSPLSILSLVLLVEAIVGLVALRRQVSELRIGVALLVPPVLWLGAVGLRHFSSSTGGGPDMDSYPVPSSSAFELVELISASHAATILASLLAGIAGVLLLYAWVRREVYGARVLR